MELVVDPRGGVRCLYTEALELAALGPPAVRRASRVEPDGEGRWSADLAVSGGPVLGPFERRSEALAAEAEWLKRHWVSGGPLGGPELGAPSSTYGR